MSKEAKARYERSLHSKKIVFYKHEQELYEFAQSINFQQFVKVSLRMLKEGKSNGTL